MATHNVLFPGSTTGTGNNQYYAGNTQEELSFQQFNYGDGGFQGYSNNGAQGTGGQGGFYSESMYSASQASIRADMSGGVTWQTIRSAFSTGGFPDEPPLLQELDINFNHIKSKGLTVMNPFKQIDRNIMDDTDLAGPILFCFLFGGFLFLSGKAHFGYIYGVATLGWLSMYSILNLMSDTGIDGYRTASVLGYALLPMVLLSSLTIVFKMQDITGVILSAVTVVWCTNSSSGMFVTVLSMKEQRLLVAYPVALLYSAFALLAVF